MADRIIISTEEMQAAVSAYEAQKQVKMDALSAMKSAVDNMDGSWDGPASEVFMAAFNSLYGKMLKTEEKMEDAIKKIEGVEDAGVNFLTQKMFVVADEANFDKIMKEVVKVCKKVEPDCTILL